MSPIAGPSSFASHALATLLLVACALIAPVANAGEDAAGNYRIKPQTKLKITVVEWIRPTGEYKEWTPLNGEFVVTPEGKISLPMVGEIAVIDKAVSEVEAAIGTALQRRTGLAEVPVATVEVTRYPMIYVTGAVDRSGEYEFRPGLTILQAVALAGGRERRQIPTGGYSEADQVRNLGELNRYQLSLKQLIARRVRLEAEATGLDTFKTPDVLSGSASVDKQILKSERALFVARTEALQHHLDSLAELGRLLKGEIDVLEKKRTVQERQVKIAEDELKMISGLVNSKTLAKTRESTSERIVAELRSSLLDLTVFSMRAQQKLSETERDTLTLKGQFKIEARRDLQAVEADINDIKMKRDTLLQVLQITGTSLAKVDDLKAIEVQPMEFWITRNDGGSEAIKVSDSTFLQPGDVLDVRLGISVDTERTASLDGTTD
ncbi:polysaccharide biosynthesis/export family protein [Rhizobium sp. TH2]|nr:polysaccharide biosynthesis/export family protein [Rhizobium sp. TH2]